MVAGVKLCLSQRCFGEMRQRGEGRGAVCKEETVILSTTEHTLQATHGSG